MEETILKEGTPTIIKQKATDNGTRMSDGIAKGTIQLDWKGIIEDLVLTTMITVVLEAALGVVLGRDLGGMTTAITTDIRGLNLIENIGVTKDLLGTGTRNSPARTVETVAMDETC